VEQIRVIHILASAKTHHEFATADAINDLGGCAIVPRKVIIRDNKPIFTPFMPNYIFLALTEAQWHEFHAGPLYWMKPQRNGEPVRTILPPFRKVLDILPRTWADFQDFAVRAEMACQRRLDQWETGLRVASYRRGDILQIIGPLLGGQLNDPVAEFLHMDAQGRIVAKVRGVEILGKPVNVALRPDQIGQSADRLQNP